jgi:hypothetical protein
MYVSYCGGKIDIAMVNRWGVTGRGALSAASAVLAFPRTQQASKLPTSPHKHQRIYDAMFRPGLRAFPNSFRPTRPHIQFRAYQQRRFGDPRPQYRRFNAAGLFMRWAARPTFYRDVGLISAGAGGFYYFNLEEVPVCHDCGGII